MTRHLWVFLFRSRILHFVSMLALLVVLPVMAPLTGSSPSATETIRAPARVEGSRRYSNAAMGADLIRPTRDPLPKMVSVS